MLSVSIGLATALTLLIVLALVFIFLIQKVYIEKHQADMKTKYIAILYIVLLAIISFAIIGIMWLWGYDVSDYIMDLGIDISAVIENSIPRLIGTLITIFFALAIMKISKISLRRVGSKPSLNQRRKKTIAKITLSVIKYVIVIVAFLAILAVWGVNIAPALAGLGILGLVIGLGAQSFINDLISGFFIIFEHHFDVGDWVEIDGFMGEVTDMGLKTTKVKDFKGEVRIFNNGSIDPVSNFSMNHSLAIIDFAIAYKEDVKKTTDILNKALPKIYEERENLLEVPRILGVNNLADSGVEMRVVALVKSMTQWGEQRAIRQYVKEILDENGIEIPFPQVTLHYAKDKTSK